MKNGIETFLSVDFVYRTNHNYIDSSVRICGSAGYGYVDRVRDPVGRCLRNVLFGNMGCAEGGIISSLFN